MATRINHDIQILNALLKQLASGVGATYVDVYNALADQEGQLQINYTVEGLHLNAEGYCTVLSILKDYFESPTMLQQQKTINQ